MTPRSRVQATIQSLQEALSSLHQSTRSEEARAAIPSLLTTIEALHTAVGQTKPRYPGRELRRRVEALLILLAASDSEILAVAVPYCDRLKQLRRSLHPGGSS